MWQYFYIKHLTLGSLSKEAGLFWLLKYVCTQFLRASWPEDTLEQKSDLVENRSVDVKNHNYK